MFYTTLITLLPMFAQLFQTGGTDSTTQTVPDEGEVHTTITLLDISSISEPEEMVIADFAVIFHWYDPELASKEAPEIRTLSLDSINAPQFTVLNGRDVSEKFSKNAMITPEGLATYRQRYQGSLSTPMDLRPFPLDKPEFFIEITMIDQKGRTLSSDSRRSGMLKAPSVAGWDISEGELLFNEIRSRDGIVTLPTARLEFTGTRNLTFFTWKLLIPLSLIVCMAYTVFWLDPAVLPAQISVATSSVFTLIAYNFALSTMLPKSSYLTRADIFIVGCTLLVFGALYESVVTGVLARKENSKALARRIDQVARYLFPVLFLGVISYAFFI